MQLVNEEKKMGVNKSPRQRAT